MRKIYTARGKVEMWAMWWQSILKTLTCNYLEVINQVSTGPGALGEVMRKSQNVNKCVTVICCTEPCIMGKS